MKCCVTLTCARKAAPGWRVCESCRDRILYGHIREKAAREAWRK